MRPRGQWSPHNSLALMSITHAPGQEIPAGTTDGIWERELVPELPFGLGDTGRGWDLLGRVVHPGSSPWHSTGDTGTGVSQKHILKVPLSPTLLWGHMSLGSSPSPDVSLAAGPAAEQPPKSSWQRHRGRLFLGRNCSATSSRLQLCLIAIMG